MKTKRIVLVLAGLGLTSALMASGPHGNRTGGECQEQKMHAQKENLQRVDHKDRMGQKRDQNQRKNFMRRMAKELDLSRDQRLQIRDVFKDMRKAKQAKRKAFRKTAKNRAGMFEAIDLEKFMSADHFNKEAFKQNILEQQAKRKAARQARRQARLDSRADMMEKIFNILTPEQRLKWIQLSKGK